VKGVIFNVVEEVLDEAFGPDMWDQVLDRAEIDGAYTSLGNYSGAELTRIVSAAAELANMSRDQVLIAAGRLGFKHLAARHGELLAGTSGWRDVLEQLDGIIHPEVKKIYPGANVPSFAARPGEESLLLEYRSHRQLCRLAEGLVRGLGDWHGIELEVRHLACVHHGDDVCVIEVGEE
jgi:hypothetical protein